MYAVGNPKTKSQLNRLVGTGKMTQVSFFQPAIGAPCPANGIIDVEGPHSPQPHTWYAQVTMKDGVAVSVK